MKSTILKVLASISKWAILAYLVSAIIPISKSNQWFIRVWDFPRLQFLILGLLFGLIYWLISKDSKVTKKIFLAFLLIGAALDFYRILPYTLLWPKEVLQTEVKNKAHSLSVITVNVLQTNEVAAPLLKMIKDKSPDIVFLLEVNKRWIRDVSSLEETYPYQLLRPLENTYGLALYSKLKLEQAEIRELIEKDIPSIYAKVILRSGEQIELYGLHPRPPHYETGDTTERDAELILVAKSVAKSKLPVIVMGDINDVAWSHTTRLFRRLSKLLDPRVGRSAFATFPATVPFLRFPLDYVFHSDHLTLDSIKRMDDVESDHFPLFIELNLTPKLKGEQQAPAKDQGDEKEAKETMKKAEESQN